MHIRLINPNTTAAMTAKIGAAAERVAVVGMCILAINLEVGLVSIESYFDEVISVVGVFDEIRCGDV